MAEELVAATAEAAVKVRGLKVTDDYQRRYFDLVAERLVLSEDLVPAGVLMALVCLEHDLAKGEDRKLAGLPPVMYAMLTRLAVTRVGEYFPEPFAEAVAAEWKAVNA